MLQIAIPLFLDDAEVKFVSGCVLFFQCSQCFFTNDKGYRHKYGNLQLNLIVESNNLVYMITHVLLVICF